MTVTLLGWLGTLGTFGAYILMARGRLTSDSRRYAALNVLGGLLGGGASAAYGAWASAASNWLWAAVGIATLVKQLHGIAPRRLVGRILRALRSWRAGSATRLDRACSLRHAR